MPRKPIRWLIGSAALALLAATSVDLAAAAHPAPPRLRITSVSPALDPADEQIAITNRDTRAVPLTGWTVKSPGQHRYAFSGVLAPGATLVVHTGAGVDDQPPGHRYRHATQPLWNIRADTVMLRDPHGTTAHTCTWHPASYPPCRAG